MPKDCLPELQIGDVAELAPTTNVNSEGNTISSTEKTSSLRSSNSTLFLLGLSGQQNVMTGGLGRDPDSLQSMQIFADGDRSRDVSNVDNSINNAVRGDLQSATPGQIFPSDGQSVHFNEADGPGASPDMPGFDRNELQNLQPGVDMDASVVNLVTANDVVTVTFQNDQINSMLAENSTPIQDIVPHHSKADGHLTAGEIVHVERETFLANVPSSSILETSLGFQNAFQLNSGQLHVEQPTINSYQNNLGQGHSLDQGNLCQGHSLDQPPTDLAGSQYSIQSDPTLAAGSQTVTHMAQYPLLTSPIESNQSQNSMFQSTANQNTQLQTSSSLNQAGDMLASHYQVNSNSGQNIHSLCPSDTFKLEQILTPSTPVSGEAIHSQPVMNPSSMESCASLPTSQSETATYQNMHIQDSQLKRFPVTSTSPLQATSNDIGRFNLNHLATYESAQSSTLQSMSTSQLTRDHVSAHPSEQLKGFDMNQSQSHSLLVNHGQFPPHTLPDATGQQTKFIPMPGFMNTNQSEQSLANSLNTNVSQPEVLFHNSNSPGFINANQSEQSPTLANSLNTNVSQTEVSFHNSDSPGFMNANQCEPSLVHTLNTNPSQPEVPFHNSNSPGFMNTTQSEPSLVNSLSINPSQAFHNSDSNSAVFMNSNQSEQLHPSPLNTNPNQSEGSFHKANSLGFINTVQSEQSLTNSMSTNVSQSEVLFHNSSNPGFMNTNQCEQLHPSSLNTNPSHSNSHHSSNQASGQCSPHLTSPHNSNCASGLNEERAQLQLDFSQSALFRQLITHISSISSPESSPSRTPLLSPTRLTPAEEMEHDTNSQSSLIEMSEKLLLDSPGQNSSQGLLPKTGLDYEAFLSHFNEDAVFDPPRKVQRALENVGAPSTVSEVAQTSVPDVSISSSAFSIDTQPGIFTFDTHNFVTSTTTSSETSASGTTKTADGGEDAVFPRPTKPAPHSRRQASGRSKKFREATLVQQFPASMDGCQLKIIDQPEDQHRARYMTEGSRGAVKDRSLQAHPSVKLFGVQETVTLQVFVGSDTGRVKPHGFYQSCKVCGKNSTPCTERDIEGTTVIELQLNPADDMTARIDCVGILKLRNADVENRIGLVKAKKKSVKARLVFRVTYKKSDGCFQTLQVASQPILCTQPIGCPEISKKSMVECSVRGGDELFIIGKNFMKGTKVFFKESGNTVWEKEAEFDKDYFQNTHLICVVPEYCDLKIRSPVSVEIIVQCGSKASDPQSFTYNPIVEPRHELMETESCQQKPLPSNVSPAAMELNRRIENESSSGKFKIPEGMLPAMSSCPSMPSENNRLKMETSQDCHCTSNPTNMYDPVPSATSMTPSVPMIPGEVPTPAFPSLTSPLSTIVPPILVLGSLGTLASPPLQMVATNIISLSNIHTIQAAPLSSYVVVPSTNLLDNNPLQNSNTPVEELLRSLMTSHTTKLS